MCLGVPARVLEVGNENALVDVMGSRINTGIIFVPEVKKGDYVLLHAGQAMTIIDEEFAQESLEEWRNIINGRHPTVFKSNT